MPDNAYDELNLPYSLEAEQAVLGAILMEPDCINQVADVLRPEHFYLPEHQAIFRVMTAKLMESQLIDFVTVLEALKAEPFFAGEEGKAAYSSLIEATQASSTVCWQKHGKQVYVSKKMVNRMFFMYPTF